jgi:CheY-like chemotaxis protein
MSGSGHRALSSSAQTATTPGTTIARILIADGDADTRQLYRATLGPLNCEIVEASDGREALVSALSRPPTLVITDTALALIDGYSLCQLLRRDAATQHSAILVATGETRSAEVDRARRNGADAVLVKPFSPDLLLTEVLRLCDPATPKRRDEPDAAKPAAAPAQRKRAHERYETMTPPLLPPQCRCPRCDHNLIHQRSYVGGVNEANAEQWDDFVCDHCGGTFEYRHRTRKLRPCSRPRSQ